MLAKDAHPAPQPANQPCTRDTLAKRLTTLRVGIITIRGARELCLIRNVSEGGLRAFAYSAVEVGETVSVELRTDQQTKGVVSWTRDHDIGIRFDDKIDVGDLLAVHAAQDGAPASRMPRMEVDRLGELRIGGRFYPISTCDIGLGGVRVEVDHPLEVGEAVVLSLEKFRPVEGSIRWYRDGTSGIAFNQAIPFHDLMRWLRT